MVQVSLDLVHEKQVQHLSFSCAVPMCRRRCAAAKPKQLSIIIPCIDGCIACCQNSFAKRSRNPLGGHSEPIFPSFFSESILRSGKERLKGLCLRAVVGMKQVQGHILFGLKHIQRHVHT